MFWVFFHKFIRAITFISRLFAKHHTVKKIYYNSDMATCVFASNMPFSEVYGFSNFLSSIVCVVQGPILSKKLESNLLSIFSADSLIWIDTSFDKSTKTKCSILTRKYFPPKNFESLNASLPQNLFLQCDSTLQGINNFQQDFAWILKIRSDIHLDIEEFLFSAYCHIIEHRHCSFQSNILPIVCSSYNSFFRPLFSVSDMIIFGSKNDVTTLFSNPQSCQKSIPADISPEQILFGLDALFNIFLDSPEFFSQILMSPEFYNCYLAKRIRVVDSWLTSFSFSRAITRDMTSSSYLLQAYNSVLGGEKIMLTERLRIIYSSKYFSETL